MATAARQLAALSDRSMTESVIYRPGGGDARTIDAVVHRGGRDRRVGAATPGIRLTVLNDATGGITPTELNSGSDRVDVAEHVGGTATARNVSRLVDEETDEEITTVEVR